MGWKCESEVGRTVGKGSLCRVVNADSGMQGSTGVSAIVMNNELPTILLASRSPRRRAFLLAAGIAHEAEHPGVEDSLLEPGDVSPQQWVMSLAYLKAKAGASQGSGRHRLVIGADTTCVVDGRMVGTPKDAVEAREIIRGFVGRSHEVLTGWRSWIRKRAHGSCSGIRHRSCLEIWTSRRSMNMSRLAAGLERPARTTWPNALRRAGRL